MTVKAQYPRISMEPIMKEPMVLSIRNGMKRNNASPTAAENMASALAKQKVRLMIALRAMPVEMTV